MKKLFISIIALSNIVSGITAQDFPNYKRNQQISTQIKISDFYSITDVENNIKKGVQPIYDKVSLGHLLSKLQEILPNNDQSGLGDVKKWINKYIDLSSGGATIKKKEQAGIIFLANPLDLQKLNPSNSSKIKGLQDKEKVLDQKLNFYNAAVAALELANLTAINQNTASLGALKSQIENIDKTTQKLSFSIQNTNASGFSAFTQSSQSIVGLSANASELEDKTKDETDKKEKLDKELVKIKNDLKKPGLTAAQKKDLNKRKSDTEKQIEDSKKTIEKLSQVFNQNYQELIGQLKSFYENKIEFLRILKERRSEIALELSSIKSKIASQNLEFSELGSVFSILIGNRGRNPERKNYQQYFYNTKEILVISLGSKAGLNNSKVSIENTTGAFESSFNELKELSKDFFIEEDSKEAAIKVSGEESKIQISFMLLDPYKIKPPTTIKISNLTSGDLEFSIHQKVMLQARVGFSINEIDRQDVSISGDDNDTFKIEVDSTQRVELKAKSFAMIEFYPFGRDNYSFQSIFNRNNGVPLEERFGLVGGLRLSQDPLEGIFGGISFALTRGFTLNAGFVMQRRLEEVTSSIDPINSADLTKTIEYLKENADKEYVPKFFIGISLSPKSFGNLIGF